MDLPQPKTNIQEVLYTLIQQGSVDLFDLPWLAGFRTRVSELKNEHLLPLTSKLWVKKNKFGNSYSYATHYLSPKNKQKAIELYNQMQIK